MTTKNIQDVVAEKVEEFETELSSKYVKTISIGQYNSEGVNVCFKTAHELMSEWLTTTLTQLVKEVEAGERKRILNLCKGTQKKLTYGRADWISFDFLLDKLTKILSNYESNPNQTTRPEEHT